MTLEGDGVLKRTLIWTCVVVVLAVAGAAIFRTYPRHISEKLHGVEFRLGSPQSGVKPVTLQLEGTLDTSLLGKQSFHGKVIIIGATYKNKDNSKRTDIVFQTHTLAGGMITYFDYKTMTAYNYGSMFTNHRFNQFTIEEFHSGWDGGSGLMISAPASSRSDGLKLANNLMENVLNRLQLK